MEYGNYYLPDYNSLKIGSYITCELSDIHITSEVEMLVPVTEDPKTIEAVTIDSSNMARFLKEIFVVFKNVTFLLITKSLKIAELRYLDFENAANLRRLKILHNHIQIIGNATFAGATMLDYLNLRMNELEIIEHSAFEGLNNLEILDISDNRLVHLEVSSFQHLSSLKDLKFTENTLKFKIMDLKNEIRTLGWMAVDSQQIDVENSNFTKVELSRKSFLLIFTVNGKRGNEVGANPNKNDTKSRGNSLYRTSSAKYIILSLILLISYLQYFLQTVSN